MADANLSPVPVSPHMRQRMLTENRFPALVTKSARDNLLTNRGGVRCTVCTGALVPRRSARAGVPGPRRHTDDATPGGLPPYPPGVAISPHVPSGPTCTPPVRTSLDRDRPHR